MTKILVAYGYHRGEQYARDVGDLFSQINPFYPDVVVKRWPVSYWPRCWRKNDDQTKESEMLKQRSNDFLQVTRSDIVIDLHDDLPMLKLYPHVPDNYTKLIPRFEPILVNLDNGKNLEREFNTVWHKQSKNKSKCLFPYGGKGISGRVPIEYHNIDGKVTTEEGARYVGMLAYYLLSKL